MGMRAAIARHPGRAAVGAGLALVAAAFALYWFAPWNLVVDRRVDEALPSVGAPAAAGEAVSGATGEAARDGGTPTEGTDEGKNAGDDAVGPVTLARGRFRSLEHETAGTALVVELPDGTRLLRLEDLATSNGPDLRVVLTDLPLSEDWHVWDDGELVDLGPLRGNLGSSNYEIPADVDLEGLRTAVVWCRRFSVGFGVAPLEAP